MNFEKATRLAQICDIEEQLYSSLQTHTFPRTTTLKSTSHLIAQIPNYSHEIQEEFFNKLSSSVKTIEKALNEYGENGLSFSFNGGKDCTILLHLYVAVLMRYRRRQSEPLDHPINMFYATIPNSFPEIENFVLESEKRYNLNMHRMKENMKEALAHFLALKPSVKGIFLGSRRTDPHCGQLSVKCKTDIGWPEVLRINPILDWTYTDVWIYLLGFNVPYCPLYDQGYTSLGRKDNTLPNQHLWNEYKEEYMPAYCLDGECFEREGRL